MAENGILEYQGMNQAIYRGATSNIVVDTQGMSIEIGAGNSSHTSNLHIECDHDANVASIKLNSNVTTEFSRSKKLVKYPRVALTQNALNNGYTVIQSGTNANEHRKAWSLFNNDVTTDDQYHAVPQSGETNPYNPSTGAYEPDTGFEDGLGDVAGEYVYVVMPDKIKLQGVSVHPRDGVLARSAESARFMGSNDGTNWVNLGGYTDYVWASGSQEPGNFFTVDSNEYYNYIGVVWTKVKGGSGGDTVNMAEVQFFGIPEYDPDADGVDVKVTSYPNVPNTDWLEVYYDAKDLADGAVTSVDDLAPSGANDGTATNVTVSDGAFVFNGTSSLLESSTTITNSTGDIPHTFSLWVKPSEGDLDDTGNHYLIVYGTELDTGKWSGISISNTRFASVIHASVVRFGPEIRVGEWYHIVLNYKSGGIHNSDRFDFFINGSRINTSALSTSGSQAGSATLNLSSPAKLVLGGLFNGSERSSSTIANARLFNRVLTTDEIYQLYAYQKEYFGHGDLSMTLKAGRLYVNGDIYANGGRVWPIPNAVFQRLTPSTTGSSAYYTNNIGTHYVTFDTIYLNDDSRTIQFSPSSTDITLSRTGVYEIITQSALALQNASTATHAAIEINILSGGAMKNDQYGYATFPTMGYGAIYNTSMTHKITVTSAPAIVAYYIQPRANSGSYLRETAYGPNNVLHSIDIKYLG